MYILFTLIITVLVPNVGFALNAKSVKFSTSKSNLNGSLNSTKIEERLQNNIFSTSLEVKEINLKPYWKLNLGYSQNTTDVSNYKVYDYVGNESSLGDHVTEHNILIDQLFFFGNQNILQVTSSSNFGTSPLRKSVTAATFYKKINNYNVFNIGLGYQVQNLPKNYFTNPDNNDRLERPSQLTTHSINLGYEKIWTEIYKMKVEMHYGHRKEDRPAYYGLISKNLYVVNDDSAVRTDFGYLVEDEKKKLMTDVGYLSSYFIESKWISNIDQYYSYAFGYGLEMNKEKKTWSKTTEQIGMDQFLFGIKYENSKWIINLDTAYAVYNTKQKGFSFNGGIEWLF